MECVALRSFDTYIRERRMRLRRHDRSELQITFSRRLSIELSATAVSMGDTTGHMRLARPNGM